MYKYEKGLKKASSILFILAGFLFWASYVPFLQASTCGIFGSGSFMLAGFFRLLAETQ